MDLTEIMTYLTELPPHTQYVDLRNLLTGSMRNCVKAHVDKLRAWREVRQSSYRLVCIADRISCAWTPLRFMTSLTMNLRFLPGIHGHRECPVLVATFIVLIPIHRSRLKVKYRATYTYKQILDEALNLSLEQLAFAAAKHLLDYLTMCYVNCMQSHTILWSESLILPSFAKYNESIHPLSREMVR